MPDIENAEIFVTIDGDRLQLILPGDGWTFDEAKLAKRVSEGMAPVTIEENLMLADPDAWMAVLRVSYARAEKDFPAGAISMEDVLHLMKEVMDATKAILKKRPPTKLRANGSSESDALSESELDEDLSSDPTTSAIGGDPT